MICKVWDAEYPWDVRVEKVATALTARGHDVHLLARNRRGGPLDERLPEATVHRLAPLRFGGGRLSAASMFPAFFNPRWIGLIHRTCRRVGAQVILCRDLPLAPAAIYAARRLGIPVMMDMAENYPAMLAELRVSGNRRLLDALVRNPAAAAWVERDVLKRLDHTIVVVEESGERLVDLGVPAERITLVSNTPPSSRLSAPERVARAYDGVLDLVYLGLLETARGIGVLLDALALCRARDLRVRLSIFGAGRDELEFRTRASQLNLAAMVRFWGHVPHQQAIDAIRLADVGVVPHFADDSWNSTIPNKLFDYMAAGVPVLTSNARPCARIVRTTQCGEVFRDREPADLVAALERLADSSRRAAMGMAGRRAIATTYNWEADSARLVSAVEETALVGRR